jgi:hypothetical protein
MQPPYPVPTLPVPLPVLSPINPPFVIQSFWLRKDGWRPYGHAQHDKLGTCRAKIASFVRWVVTGALWEYKLHKDIPYSPDFKIHPNYLNMGDIFVVRVSGWNVATNSYETLNEYSFYP